MKLADAVRLANKPEGWRIAARFVAAVEAGGTPDRADLEAVAQALAALIDPAHLSPDSRMKASYRRLGMQSKQGGDKGPEAGEVEHRVETVARILLREKAIGLAAAKREAAERMAERDPDGRDKLNTVSRWCKAHKDEAQALLRFPAFRRALTQ